MGAGPIPWVAVDQYARRMELNWEECAHFEFCIMAMDRVFLENKAKAHGDRNKDHKARD